MVSLHRRAGVRAFTLVEVLVVITIVALLIGLLIPAVSYVRESSRRTECLNRLRQQGLAVANYENSRQRFPIGCIGCRFNTPKPGQPFVPQRFLSWNIQLLPHLEEQALFDQFDLAQPSYKSPNKEAGAKQLPVFLCPSTRSSNELNPAGLWQGMAFTDFSGIYGVEGEGRSNTDSKSFHYLNKQYLGVMLYEQPTRVTEIADGLSNTVLIAEALIRRQTENEWASGHNVFAQEGSTGLNERSGLGNDIGSPHPGGAGVVYCDGHIEFLSSSIDQAVLNAKLTRAGQD